MTQDCPVCSRIKSPGRDLLYGDETIIAFLDDQPSSWGQVVVMPKEHYPILELVPDDVIGQLGVVANKLAAAVFEGLGYKGTNLLITNGLAAGQRSAHFSLKVIPRKEDDALSLSWTTKQLGEEEMSTIELKLKQETDSVAALANRTAAHSGMPQGAPMLEPPPEEGEEDYTFKQLKRIP